MSSNLSHRSDEAAARLRPGTRHALARVLRQGTRLLMCTLLGALWAGAVLADDKSELDRERQRAQFYAPYAAMATEVYRNGSAPESWFSAALSTAWLRREVDVHGTPLNQKRFFLLELGRDEERREFLEKLHANCLKELGDTWVPVELLDLKLARAHRELESLLRHIDSPHRVNCYALRWELMLEADSDRADPDEVNLYDAAEPEHAKHCDWSSRGGKRERAKPRLNVQEMVDRAGWTRVPELRRVSAVRGWRVFVPELAIDVWQRQRAAVAGHRIYEYAIVFRGTVGGGGWVSNFRGLTAGLPIFWDQYAQALDVTRKLVAQIQAMHVLRDHLLEVNSEHPTTLLFTTVGHSLGGGLAQHVFLNVPEITRVVAFDPSPLDGSSLVPPHAGEHGKGSTALHEAGWDSQGHANPAASGITPQTLHRAGVMQGGARPIDTAAERTLIEEQASGAAIYLLHEHGEALSRMRHCQSGSLWGDEGGPVVACESVNYSTGGPFAQHNMAELACRLDLASRGRPPRTSP